MIEVLDYPQHRITKIVSILSITLSILSFVGSIVLGTAWFVATDFAPGDTGLFARTIMGAFLIFGCIASGAFWLGFYQILRYLACVTEYIFKGNNNNV